MTNKFPGQEYLFDDDEDDIKDEPAPVKRTIAGGGDPAAFVGLATRIPGLRLTPVTHKKIPVEKGWAGGDYWQKNADIVKSIKAWCAEYGRPNFAFCLGPKCGPGGDLVLEPDNQAGEDWLAAHVPQTPIMTVTRKGWFHRHMRPDPPDPESGFSRGNITDVFGSKKRHQQMATAAGYDVIIDRDRKNDPEYLAYIASERERAERDIPMGPIIDLKCAGGQAMCPGSVHETGYVYREHAPWTLQGWNARPTFDPKWFPPEVWAERARVQMLVADQRDDDRIDAWWTPDRKYAAALAYTRKVPPKSTGDNSSGTFMRLATVLVRGFSLEPTQARELATFWARDICGHEPWTRKEIEHKLRQAFDKGAMAWGAKLQDRSRNPDARLEAAEQQIADMLAGRSKRAVFVADHVHDLDLVALPADFVDEPMAIEAREPDAVIDPLGFGPADDDLVARGDVLVREADVEKAALIQNKDEDDDIWTEPEPMSMTEDTMRAQAKSIVQRNVDAVNNVVDIGHARLAKSQEHGGHGATPESFDDDVFAADEEIETTINELATTQAAPTLTPGSQEQLRKVFAQFNIDLADIRRNNELYHTKTDQEGNIIGLDTTTNNIALVFKYSRAYKKQFRMNEMSEEQEFAKQPMIDSMDLLLKQNIDAWFGREVPKERVRDAAHLACLADRYNPVREYIDNLPEWDGVDRWDLLAEHVLFAKVQGTKEHNSALIRKWGFSAMARALQPGCQAEGMLVLQSSRQGMFKTTFGKTLFGEDLFSNQALNINDRDSRMVMFRNWCMEIGEGEILSTPSKVMAFKAFLSQSIDDVRLPYGRRIIRLRRRGVFLATTNESRFLHDPTGSRRFFVIVVGKEIDIKRLAEMRDQLWAEAYYKVTRHMKAEPDSPEYLAGMWWLTKEEEAYNQVLNQMHQTEDAWEERILKFFVEQGRKPFTIGQALQSLNLTTQQQDWVSTRRVTEIIRKFGSVPYANGKTTRVGGVAGRFWVPPDTLPGEDT